MGGNFGPFLSDLKKNKFRGFPFNYLNGLTEKKRGVNRFVPQQLFAHKKIPPLGGGVIFFRGQ